LRIQLQNFQNKVLPCTGFVKKSAAIFCGTVFNSHLNFPNSVCHKVVSHIDVMSSFPAFWSSSILLQ
jgi:hypothetical protein